VGGVSYAGTSQPDPWRRTASAVVAPTTLPPFFFFNNSMALTKDSLLLEFDLRDKELNQLLWCCLKNFTSKMQQIKIGAVMCLPNYAMGCSCGRSVRAFASVVDKVMSMLLQMRSLHTRKGHVPTPCFSAHFVAANQEAVWRGGADFAQKLFVRLEALVSKCWYARLKLHNVLPLEMNDSCFWPIAFAAHCRKYQNWNSLLTVNLWKQVNTTAAVLLDNYVHMHEILELYFRPMVVAAHSLQCLNWNNFLSVSLWTQDNIIATLLDDQLCSHTTNDIHGQQRSWNYTYAYMTINSGGTTQYYEQDYVLVSSKCMQFFLPDGHLVEDAVLPLFGLCHQRWTTTSLSLIPRFNGGDPLGLSSVMVHQNLQLNPPQPRVHTPDRPSGEPPAGHQLVWSTLEALEGCICSNIESVLSADERSLFGFIDNLWYQLQGSRSSLFLVVHVGTFDPCSTLCRRDVVVP
jgi:hypothetical protein